jgi:hypothetical protein
MGRAHTAGLKPANLGAVLRGAPYISNFGCHALSMDPNQATQWSDADLETCGLDAEDIRDMRARLRGAGVGPAPQLCEDEAG